MGSFPGEPGWKSEAEIKASVNSKPERSKIESKYNVGDKFIIEIDSVMTNHKGMMYGIRGFTSLVMTDFGLEQLEKYPESTLNDAYDRGYERAISDAKQLIRTVYANHAFARQAELDDVLGKLDEKTVVELSS